MNDDTARQQQTGWAVHLRRESMLLIGAATAVVFLVADDSWLDRFQSPYWQGFKFVWLFTVVLLASMFAVRHAEEIAEAFGEPYGTLILTAAVTSIEVTLIASVMLGGDNSPTFARETLFAAAMIVLNGLVGLGLLLGGLKFREQQYNLQGANSYLVVIIPLAAIGLTLPDFTTSTVEPTLSRVQSLFLILVSLALYGIFLLIQTSRHRSFFTSPEKQSTPDVNENPKSTLPTSVHVALLFAYLVAVIVLAEQLAEPIDHAVENLGAPVAFGGLIVAMLVLTPEGVSGLRAALDNNLQRAVNIFLGSILATISLTIPVILTIGLLTDRMVILGLAPTQTMLLYVTLLVSLTTFSSARTNILHGAVHLLLFFVFIVLIFVP